MSTRLQVILDEAELAEIRVVADRYRMTVSEWVRHALREARRNEPTKSLESKLAALDEAYKSGGVGMPAVEIEQMLDEIAQGYEYDALPDLPELPE
jgi:hypothetical protein